MNKDSKEREEEDSAVASRQVPIHQQGHALRSPGDRDDSVLPPTYYEAVHTADDDLSEIPGETPGAGEGQDSKEREEEDSAVASRQVPIHQQGHALRSPGDRDNSVLPPTYYEAVHTADDDLSERPGETPGAGEGQAGAAPASEGLSPEEISVIFKMQSERNEYLPDRRGSYEEAVEMIQPSNDGQDCGRPSEDENNISMATSVDTMQPVRASQDLHSVEAGEAPTKAEFTCYSCGPLNQCITCLVRFLRNQSTTRLVLIGLLVVALIGLVLFLGLFPASFVYIEYYQVALPQSKMTNVVDRDKVYYPGCYILGPDTKLVRFQSSAHVINAEMAVFTLDTISITIRYSLVYFLRPKEVGQLYSKFLHDYEDVFKMIIRSSIRNLAATSYTVDNFRFNRTYVETGMHAMLRKKLGGDCCPACCPRGCQSNTYCDTCKTDQCDLGYHIDARYFNLLSVAIPDEVFERYLRFTILEIEKEKEFFLQDYAVTQKETTLLTERVKNEGKEIIQNGTFAANKVAVISEAEKEKTVTTAYTEALQGMYRALNITRPDYKASLMMIRALEDSIDNIYVGYGYNMSILYGHAG